jgi:Uncharacterized protein, possibly involved in glyoxylate utilization
LKINDIALRISYLNAKDNDADQLYDALLSGKAVGVDFHLDRTEKMDDKVARFKRDIPYLNHARLTGTHFDLSVTKPFQKVEFIGQNGIVLKEENYNKADAVTTAYYDIQPSDMYVRTVLTFFDGSTMWLNPVTRHESNDITKQRLDHISYFWTITLWAIYIGIIILIVKLVKNTSRIKKIHLD